MRLDNIRVLCTHFDQTFAFYRDVLGLTVTWGEVGGNFASFDTGGRNGLGLFDRDLMAAALGEVPSPSAPLQTALVFEVPDLDVFHSAATEQGVNFITPPHDMPDWGSRVTHLRDPEGNVIEVFAHLAKAAWSDDLREEAQRQPTRKA